MRYIVTIMTLAAMCIAACPGICQNTAPVDVSGEWSITLTFVAGTGHHTAVIEQNGARLSGTYKGERLEGRLSGAVEGNTVRFSGRLRHESTGVSFRYEGTINNGKITGTVDMGEYWTAEFTAERKK